MSFKVINKTSKSIAIETLELLDHIDQFQYAGLDSYCSLGSIHNNIDVQIVDDIPGKKYETTISIGRLKELIGRLESLAEQEYIPTIEDISIPLGKYLSGNQILKGSPNLLPGNIKKGVEIFGVTGTFEGSGGSVKKGTILDTTTSTSQQDTLNNWGNKCYIKDGDLDWMTLNDIVAHWGGVASQSNFIGRENEKYGIYMTNWTESEKATSILFIEPFEVIAGDFLLTFNCNISNWMNQTLNIHFLTATGNTKSDILTQLTEKIAAEDYVKTITLTYIGPNSQKDVTIIDTTSVAGNYYMYIDGFKKSDNSNFNLIKIDYINF